MTISAAVNSPSSDGNATAFDPSVHFISLDRIRHEMRVPQIENSDGEFEFTTDEDEILIPIFESAVSYTARHLNIPILQQDALMPFCAANNQRIRINDPFVRSVISISYRPDQNAALVDLNSDQYRVESPDGSPPTAGTAYLYPVGDWPANRGMSVRYRRGITENYPDLQALRSMVVLRGRSDYDAVNSLPDESRTAYERLAVRLGLPASLPVNARVVT